MKKFIQVCTFVFATLLFATTASASPSTAHVSNLAADILSDLEVRDVELEVMTSQYAKQDPWVQALLKDAPSEPTASMVVTALYYQGTCTILINSDNAEQATDKTGLTEDALFFATAHAVSHCVSKRQQGANRTLSKGTTVPTEVQKHREEAFADVLASLYVRVKKDNAGDILSTVLGERIKEAESYAVTHSTAIYVTAAMKYEGELSLSKLVDISYAIRM